MKKTFTTIFAAGAALTLAACGGEAPEETNDGLDGTGNPIGPAAATAEGEAEEGNDGLDGTSNPIGPAAEESVAEE